VIIPDLEHMLAKSSARNFVIVPLILRSQGIGIFIIHTEKPQQEFSNQDIQLLSVLANQAAVGVENWRTYKQLLKANDELKASQAQMVQAAKLAAIGELAAGIAHEIKNPLQVLMLHLELVQSGRPLPNWIEMFSRQLKRLSDITLRLMNFARNVSEEVTTEAININKAIDDIVIMVQQPVDNTSVMGKRATLTTMATIADYNGSTPTSNNISSSNSNTNTEILNLFQLTQISSYFKSIHPPSLRHTYKANEME